MHSADRSPPAVKYVADITGVTEVTLRGTAAAAFWAPLLETVQLFPYQESGRAVLMLSATEGRWRGFRFREFVIAVGACFSKAGQELDGYYLPSAFNNVKLLAFSERLFFRTPYLHADIHVASDPPAGMRVESDGAVLLEAEMTARQDAKPTAGFKEWEGPIFLPAQRGKFFALLSGDTRRYPFSTERDRVEISASAAHLVFAQLQESDFIGNVWSVRTNARHARSKTYKHL